MNYNEKKKKRKEKVDKKIGCPPSSGDLMKIQKVNMQ